MDRDISFAIALARALMEGKDSAELARLQIVLQTVSSLVTAELGCLRLSASETQSTGGASK